MYSDRLIQNRPGYYFAGWYIDPACTKRVNPGWKPESPFTLYDKWIPIPYAITYRLNGGTNTRRNPRFVTIEAGIKKLYPATKPGYSFGGWYYNGQKMDFLPEGIHEPIELEARFYRPRKVEFYLTPGSLWKSAYSNETGQIEPFEVPKVEGYRFRGWYRDLSYQKGYDFEEIVDRDLKLYARWSKETYQIYYDLDGGYFESRPFYSYQISSVARLLPVPKKEGYKFEYWSDEQGRISSILRSNTTGDHLFTAHWKADEPELHFASLPYWNEDDPY